MMLENELRQVLNKENKFRSYYAGGTLFLDDPAHGISLAGLNLESRSFVVKNDEELPFKLNSRELYLLAKIYVQNKPESSAFYSLAQGIIKKHRI